MCFYETNPPFFEVFLIQLPLHMGLATEMNEEFRWVRFPKRTHREGVLDAFWAGWRCFLPAEEDGERAGRPTIPAGRGGKRSACPTNRARRRGASGGRALPPADKRGFWLKCGPLYGRRVSE